MKYLLFIALFITFPSLCKTPPPIKLYPFDQSASEVALKKHQGIVLLEIDVDGTSSSLEFSQLRVSGQSYLKAEQKPQTNKKTHILNFSGIPAGYYFFKAPAGLYQIKQIKVPYYNLPFRLDTENRSVWRFSVEPQKINFIGRLEIEKARAERSVRVELINRIATNQQEILERSRHNFPMLPLRNGVGVRDDFFLTLNNSEEVASENEIQ